MPLPIPNLDDRRFDDLVVEAKARIATHLPELTQIAPGDPVHALVDMFAWMTETILYRANLIPERQRRVVLNLLQVPLRTARPARGVVCIDAGQRDLGMQALVRDGAQLKAGAQSFTAVGELQPTCLELSVLIKQTVADDELAALGLSLRDLQEQYGIGQGDRPLAFQPHAFELGKDLLPFAESIDQCLYLALLVPKPLLRDITTLRNNLAGRTLNIAIAPADELDGEQAQATSVRNLVWELLSRDEAGNVLALPLELVSDSSRGGRQTGVVRVRLPRNAALLQDLLADDPMFAGVGDMPPELPAPLSGERVAFWLRLRAPEEPALMLGYLGVNAIEVLGQGRRLDAMVGVGNGRPDQMFKLPDVHIDPASIQLQVEEEGAWVDWQRVDFLLDHGGDARVYRLDPAAGLVHFGDGLEGGKRPPAGMRIRVASYRFGGGVAGNAKAGEIKELSSGGSRLTVRHEWPLQGGVDAESVEQAERRIPQFLTHRNRAVTKEDFKLLAEHNPVNPVARAEVLEGFLPGAKITAARSDVPGVVSVFVLPPRTPALRQSPRPSKGLLKDVFEYLIQRVLVGTELYVLSPEFVPLAVGVTVDVLDADTEQETLRAVQSAVVNFLWALAPGGARGEGWALGAAVTANELMTQAARVPGVRAVKALSLFARKGDGAWVRLDATQSLVLKPYQLPELLGVSVGSGNGEPEFPGGIEAGSTSGSGRVVPAPVIPDLC